MLWVKYIDFSKVYAQAGESRIINLSPDRGKGINVIVHDVERDPLKDTFLHIDFFQVRMDETLETHVPLEFTGVAPAVFEAGGILVKTLEEVLIKCLPKDLPHALTVDLSQLKNFGEHIQVKDLVLPEGVEILAEGNTTVALVEAPRTEEEIAALDEKVEVDVTKVEGVVKETPAEEAPTDEKADAKTEEKSEEKPKKEEKK